MPRPSLRDDTAPPDITGPPVEDVGLGVDWMLGQRDALYQSAREATVQGRLNIRYRLTPVFIPPSTPAQPTTIQSAFSGMNVPPNLTDNTTG